MSLARISPADAVLLALVPGILALCAGFGWGSFANMLWALGAALVATAAVRLAGGQAVRGLLADRGPLLAATIFAVALPPASPWWLATGGAALAVGVVRPLNAALGCRFNPAMAAYALLLLAFPLEMTHWLAPGDALPGTLDAPDLLEALRASLGLLPGPGVDAMTMATPLDLLRLDNGHTVAELRALHPQLHGWSGPGWQQANLAFLGGGLWLLWRGILRWHTPAALLGTLAFLGMMGNDGGSSASGGSPLLHLFAGGTMLAAFFVVTEPQAAPAGARGQLVFGVLIGALAYTMRVRGTYADGMAFAVLLANAAVPLLDRLDTGVTRRMAGTGSTGRARAGLALTVVVTGGLLALDWLGTRNTRPAPDIPLGELLGALAHGAETAPFPVQDLALLGLAEPRPAYRVLHAGKAVAVVLPARANDGYGGPIELLVGIREDGVLSGVRVLSHQETPGFGDAIESSRSDWIRGFAGRSLTQPEATRWALRRDGGEFDQFTGATTTPRAVVAAVARALQYFAAHREALLAGSPP